MASQHQRAEVGTQSNSKHTPSDQENTTVSTVPTGILVSFEEPEDVSGRNLRHGLVEGGNMDSTFSNSNTSTGEDTAAAVEINGNPSVESAEGSPASDDCQSSSGSEKLQHDSQVCYTVLLLA